jgi:hypothetical protein
LWDPYRGSQRRPAEGRDEELLDIGVKALAIDRIIEQAGRANPILGIISALRGPTESVNRPMRCSQASSMTTAAKLS